MQQRPRRAALAVPAALLLLLASLAAHVAAQGAVIASEPTTAADSSPDVEAELLTVPTCAPAVPATSVAKNQLPGGVFGCRVQRVLTSNQTDAFTFVIPPMDAKKPYGLLITARTINGFPRLTLVNENTGLFLPGDKVFQTEATSEYYIRLPASVLTANPGTYSVAVGGVNRAATYTLSVSTPLERPGSGLNAANVAVMQDLADQCCSKGNSTSVLCSDVLPTALAANHTAEQDLCNQGPIFCDEKGNLVQLSLPDQGLDCGGAGLPPSFATLQSLQMLDLAFNNIGGDTSDVADLIAKLPKLERLFLRYTGISGKFWCGLVNSTALTLLSVSGNPVSGTVPRCILSDPTLQELYMSFTNLTGTLPDVVPVGSPLRVLYSINDNVQDGFTGVIPPSLNNAELKLIDLSGHSFKGDVPPLPASLLLVNVSANNLDGSISGVPAAAEVMDVSYNKLQGGIPADVGASRLREMWYERNALSGGIPELPETLRVLSVSNNQLTGPLPALPAKLLVLSAWNNQLGGSLPPLPRDSGLTVASCRGNNLEGPVPASWVGPDSNLQYIDLSNNSVAMPRADAAAPVDQGRRLQRAGRKVLQAAAAPAAAPAAPAAAPADAAAPAPPGGVWQLPGLRFLDLSSNPLGGELPLELAQQSSLAWLDLSGGQMQGDLGAFAKALADGAIDKPLAHLNLSSNAFTGPLPDAFADSPMLTSNSSAAVFAVSDNFGRALDLSNNALAGPFPLWLLSPAGPANTSTACNCDVSVGVSGPQMRLQCPDAASLTQAQRDVAAQFNYTCVKPGGEAVMLSDGSPAPAASQDAPPVERPPTVQATAGPQGGGEPRGLARGAIAGVVVGLVVLLALVAALVLVALRWKRRQGSGWYKDNTPQNNPLEVEAAFGMMPVPAAGHGAPAAGPAAAGPGPHHLGAAERI